MNAQLFAVELSFENIDYVVIPIQYFSSFSVDNVQDRQTYFKVDPLVFELKPEADKDTAMFDRAMLEKSLFERMMRRDITQIDALYRDGTKRIFVAPWEDEDGCDWINALQTSSVTTSGSMRVHIGYNLQEG